MQVYGQVGQTEEGIHMARSAAEGHIPSEVSPVESSFIRVPSLFFSKWAIFIPDRV